MRPSIWTYLGPFVLEQLDVASDNAWPGRGRRAKGLDGETTLDAAAAFGHGRGVTSETAIRSEDDAALVSAASDGDRAAFGRLYEKYARMVHGILLARVSHSDVDDLVQDVFLMAMRRLGSLRDGEAFGGWLAVIARNRARDHHRRAQPTGVLDDQAVAADPRRAEALEALAVVCSLPDAYRETLILRLVEGMTGPEIAARCGLTPGSVRVNLHRGMKLLRAKLGMVQDDE